MGKSAFEPLAAGEAMIRTRGLSKLYGRFQALESLDLSVARGEVFGFLGLNGAGKSTTLRLLTGLLRPSSGEISIGGEPLVWPDRRQVRSRIGYLPQSLRFHEPVAVGRLIDFYCGLSGLDTAGPRRRAREWGVPLDRRVGVMSPGQQRKLGLLLATLGDPELLFLDEPTAGLDPEGQAEVRRLIAGWREQGVTVFVSSHILGEIQQVCSSIGILHHGKLLYTSPIEEGYEVEVGGFDLAQWRGGPVVLQSHHSTNGYQKLLVRVPKREIPALVSELVRGGAEVYGVREQSLEDKFNLVVGGLEG